MYKLVVATSRSCPSCHQFETEVWKDKLLPLLIDQDLDILEWVLPDVRIRREDKTVPKMVKYYVNVFPRLLLISTDQWNKAFKDPTFIPEVSVFGATFGINDKKLPYPIESDMLPLTFSAIADWINRTTGSRLVTSPPSAIDLETLNRFGSRFEW